MVAITQTKSLLTYSGAQDPAVSAESAPTDVTYQEIRLYVEGVQVPFEAISISQVSGELPTASIQVPPQSGLQEICKYYSPKVHVFYKDDVYGGLRLLFWGVIDGSTYAYSRAGSGSASVTFSATHKNSVLDQVTLDYSGYLAAGYGAPVGESGTVVANALNSGQSVVKALEGIDGVQDSDTDLINAGNKDVLSVDVKKLPKALSEVLPRYVGMPATIMNLWNQTKQAAYSQPKKNLIMQGLLVPAVEEGIGFFKRLSGHVLIEQLLNNSKQQCCLKQGTNANIVIPPVLKLGLASAEQARIAVEMVSNSVQFSNELTDFRSVIRSMLSSLWYEMETLASPAEVPVDPTVVPIDGDYSNTKVMAVETIIKPSLPFYYAPVCNVILPKMLVSITCGQKDGSVPTRVTVTHDSMPTPGGSVGTNFRGPATVREAIAFGAAMDDSGKLTSTPSLVSTLGITYSIPGVFEQGRGVIPVKEGLPWWLQTLVVDRSTQAQGGTASGWPDRGTQDYTDMVHLMAAWKVRNGVDISEVDGVIVLKDNPNKAALNPYAPQSGLAAYQSLIITGVDYTFSRIAASSRAGSAEVVFNPYVVPGYPIEILDDTPTHPSYHAFCSSVTHSITASSISTTIGFVAAQTYAELSNYYTLPVPPWFQTALSLVSASGDGGTDYGSTDGITVTNAGSIINNSPAALKADEYYQSVLGVGAADITFLVDWATGQIKPQGRVNGKLYAATNTPNISTNGGDLNYWNTATGNLRLVSRPIESQRSIAAKFSYTFVDLTQETYGGSLIPYTNPLLSDARNLEPGASLFLDYLQLGDFVNAVSGSTPDTGSSSDFISRRYKVN